MNMFQKLRRKIGAKILGSEYKKIKKELKSFDYELAYHAYKKYTLSIIDEPRDCLEFSCVDDPVVSIVIPVYNQYKFTMRCLQSILDTTVDIKYQVIIADDHSTDQTQNLLEKVTGISVIKNATARGFLTNCNYASQFALGKYIYLLNNDTQLFPDAIASLVEEMEKDNDLVIVGSKCVMPNSKLQAAGSYWGKKGYTFDIGRDDNPLKDEFNHFAYVDYCTGASLMIRRDFWEEEKGFDECFAPGYYEETDLCARAKQRGLKVAYQPRSELIHFVSVTFNQYGNNLMAVNRKKFLLKWKKLLKL